MSHAHANTLLARLGFLDPDRGIPEHDRACISLVENPYLVLEHRARPSLEIKNVRVALESPVQKGQGQYATTIGFADAVVNWEEQSEEISCETTAPHDLGPCCRARWPWKTRSMLVEVKTSIESIGDLLRQMNLYREYQRTDEYLVWSLDRRDSQFEALLETQGYHLVAGDRDRVSEVRQAVSRVLKSANGPLSKTKIWRLTGKNKGAILSEIDAMADEGLIKLFLGGWVLPP